VGIIDKPVGPNPTTPVLTCRHAAVSIFITILCFTRIMTLQTMIHRYADMALNTSMMSHVVYKESIMMK